MKVFGLELEQSYAEMFISAISANGSEAFTQALADCTDAEIRLLETMLDEYYRKTVVLRERGASNQRMESIALLLSAASAPIITRLLPILPPRKIDIPSHILLAQFSFPDRKYDFDIRIARGYMVERLITEGNTWEKPVEDYLWLGENYPLVVSVADELIKRSSVDCGLIVELSNSKLILQGGSL